ncbi:MAG: tetratricopeptide repeat protein [Fusobacteriota bacterium]
MLKKIKGLFVITSKILIISIIVLISTNFLTNKIGRLKVSKINLEEVNSKTSKEWLDSADMIKRNFGMNEDVLLAYKNALKTAKENKDKSSALRKIAYYYHEKGDYKNAESSYEKAIEIYPEGIKAYIGILDMYVDKSDKKKAEKKYLEAMDKLENGVVKRDINLGYVVVNLNYANFWRGKKNANKALKYLKIALSKIDNEVKKEFPDYWGVYLLLGTKYAMLKEYKKTIKYEKMVLKQSPNNPRALNTIAFAYDMLGEYELALEYYRKALKYGSPHAKKNIEIMKKQMKQNSENDKK